MSWKAWPFTSAAFAAALAVSWLASAAHAEDRGRGGGRGDDRRWVQPAEPRGGGSGERGGDRRWVQPADPRGGSGWQQRGDQREFDRQRPDGWRGRPPPQRERGDRQPQDHPGRGGPPPVYVQPPQVQPPPQWQGREAQRPERRWNPQAPRLRPGDRLPPQYRQRQFVVDDWRAHRLYAPPPGHQWVQPEPGNYILIGPNGEIVNMLVGQ